MTGYEIFWPVVAQVLLVYVLYGFLRIRRTTLRREGRLTNENIRWSSGEPEESLKVKNCIANQFEAPVLFYLCSVLLYLTEADTLPMVILSWVFVASRYAHAAVQVSSNRVALRFPLFALGLATQGLMWLWLAVWMAGG